MENEDSQSTEVLDLRARKFIHAGYGFLGLNLVWLAIGMLFIPPFNLGLSAILSLVAFVLLLGLLTYYLLKGKKMLAQILAVIFGIGLFVVGFDQGHIFSLVMGESAFDEMFIHELTHDLRHAAGFPCH